MQRDNMHFYHWKNFLVALIVIVWGMACGPNVSAPTITTRVSIASNGKQGNAESYHVFLSADGRYVGFSSEASNLVSGDTNEKRDVFMHDIQTGTTTRVSVATDGTQGDARSYGPSISADGRYVVFSSEASNLVSGDTNGADDIFVHDMQTGTTTRVSVATDGTQGNGDSGWPSNSADGRYVAFESAADNLVSGDMNDEYDVFVHDMQTGTTTLVSLALQGTNGNNGSYYPSISADGRYIAFDSYASNLATGDTNSESDVFVHNTQTGTTTRISIVSDGTQGNAFSAHSSISADGRYVAFESEASNLVSGDTNHTWDIFVHDMQTGIITCVSVAANRMQGNGASRSPSISADGLYVAFLSAADNLVSRDTNSKADIFVHDMQTETTTLASLASDGTQGNADVGHPSISANGYYVVFDSSANNLVNGDTNLGTDVFLRVLKPSTSTPQD